MARLLLQVGGQSQTAKGEKVNANVETLRAEPGHEAGVSTTTKSGRCPESTF